MQAVSRAEVFVAAVGALLILSVGLTDGGYYGRSYTALTVLLFAAALLAIVVGVARRPSVAGLSLIAVLATLTAWTALSALWAVRGAAVTLEWRRGVLYVVALAAIVVMVDAARRLPLLAGLLGGITAIALVAVGMRVASGAPVDRFYGSLLEEPVGYPNALGVLMAMGVVLAAGLISVVPGMYARGLGAVVSFLVFVLGLTGSRGGALALGVGAVVLIALAPRSGRRGVGLTLVAALTVGGACWAIVQWRGAEGAALTALACACLVTGWAVSGAATRLSRRAVALFACALLVVGVTLVVLRPPAVSSSYRTDYWRAAMAEWSERPLLGSGAGSFFLDWREHRTIDLGVRDAHSVYVEALTELGPIGLALVVAFVAIPLAGAVRRRGDPLTAAAASAFVVFAAHAGIDWDWEMPVVTLAGLGLAGAVVARAAPALDSGKRHRGGEHG